MPNVYAYRLKPRRKDHTEDLLANNQIAIGWSEADVMDPSITWEGIRAELDRCYGHLKIKAQISKDTDHVWRFLKELKIGDIVVVPHVNDIHFVKVTGNPVHVIENVKDDTAHRRSVVKLLEMPIRRHDLPSSVQNSLKFRPTSEDLAPVKTEIFELLGINPVAAARAEEAAKTDRLMKEALGPYVIPALDERVVARKHAEVSDALEKHLKKAGYEAVNTPVGGLIPDLYTVDDNPQLFEIKIGSGSGDYLKALGQLLFCERYLRQPYRKYLVAPPGIKDEAKDIMAGFDIGIIEYTEVDGSFSFAWPTYTETKTATPNSLKPR